MISVVIPLYNKAGLIGRALDSILRQEDTDAEVIIVDDGSTDSGAEVARRFGCAATTLRSNNPGVVLRIIAQANAGVGAARNRGIAEARGEWVAFLDADDEWLPGHLAALRRLAAEHPACDVVATNYENRLADGQTVPNRLKGLERYLREGVITDYFSLAAESNPPLWTSALMVRKRAIEAVGGFPTGIRSGEDLLTWARLAARGAVAFDPEPSAVYHRGSSNPRPPEAVDEVGLGLEALLKELGGKSLRRYVAMWYNMRMSRCLAHRMYARALRALLKSLRYRPTPRILKPLAVYTLLGLRSR